MPTGAGLQSIEQVFDTDADLMLAPVAYDLSISTMLASGWQLARMYWQADRQALAACADRELLEMACAHLERFSRIGLTENFTADFAAILSDLDMPVPQAVPRRFETREPLRAADLAPATLERLRQRMALDSGFALALGSATPFPPDR